MDQNKKLFFRNQAASIIKKMELRNMQGFYCDTMEEAMDKTLELIGNGKKSVAYGGSMTIDNTDLKERIVSAGHELVIRENAKTPEEQKEMKAKQINADTFLMSSNAVTVDGELINIDGRGNRVSYLIYGPEQVILIVGMQKIVKNVEEGIDRVRNQAAPPNTVRLHCDTPCAKTGVCANCLPNSICANIVITRKSMIPNRIKVIFVGEDVGY